MSLPVGSTTVLSLDDEALVTSCSSKIVSKLILTTKIYAVHTTILTKRQMEIYITVGYWSYLAPVLVSFEKRW